MMNEKSTPLKFSWMEFSGSLGDLGLFLPLVIAMTISCDLDIGVVLILAGLMNVISGWLFRQPIPVQPMKALAAVVITEGLIKDELFAAGIMLGVILVVLSFFIERITQIIPKAIVRGIQLGVGLKLAAKGAEWIAQLNLVGWDSIFSAFIIIVLLLLLLYFKKPALIFIFLLGFILHYFDQREIYLSLTFSVPELQLQWPAAWAFKHGFYKGVLPQLPLTLLNSVVAVCALSADYFPGKGISHRKMTLSVGLMNIFCIPFGGIPMCHGSGGLAAQYRFGARTGGSVIMLGGLKIMMGLIFGAALFDILQTYPAAVLGPMLIFAGLELAKASKDVFKHKDQMVIMLITAAVILGVNTFAGFLAGCILSLVNKIVRRKH